MNQEAHQDARPHKKYNARLQLESTGCIWCYYVCENVWNTFWIVILAAFILSSCWILLLSLLRLENVRRCLENSVFRLEHIRPVTFGLPRHRHVFVPKTAPAGNLMFSHWLFSNLSTTWGRNLSAPNQLLNQENHCQATKDPLPTAQPLWDPCRVQKGV